MTNTISKYYFFNRYSWFFYCLFSSLFIIYEKNNEWSFEKNIVLTFLIINAFFLFWFLYWGTFRFSRQVKVERKDYETIELSRGKLKRDITKEDIRIVKFYEVFNTGMQHRFYKIQIITKGDEIFSFSYMPNKYTEASLNRVNKFYVETNNFFGLCDIEKIKMAKNVFDCN